MRGTSQVWIGVFKKLRLKAKSSLRLNCPGYRLYIQVRTSMTNCLCSRLISRLVSPSVIKLVSVIESISTSVSLGKQGSVHQSTYVIAISHCTVSSHLTRAIESVHLTPHFTPSLKRSLSPTLSYTTATTGV